MVDLSVAAAVHKHLVQAAATEPPGVAARDRESVKVKHWKCTSSTVKDGACCGL